METEGRYTLVGTLVLAVSEKRAPGSPAALVQGNQAQLDGWAAQAGHILAGMRVAGGSVLPSRPAPGKRVRPWMATVPEEPAAAEKEFRQWRRQWLPGFALVGRGDLLATRLAACGPLQPRAASGREWHSRTRWQGELGRSPAPQRQWLGGTHPRGLCRTHANKHLRHCTQCPRCHGAAAVCGIGLFARRMDQPSSSDPPGPVAVARRSRRGPGLVPLPQWLPARTGGRNLCRWGQPYRRPGRMGRR